jgi:hypothetical protein
MARGKHANQVVVAIARELVGFMGAIAHQVPVTRYVPQRVRPWTNTVSVSPARALERGRWARWGRIQDCIPAVGGMLPPVVLPCGHCPQRGLHEPAGGRRASRPHDLPQACFRSPHQHRIASAGWTPA